MLIVDNPYLFERLERFSKFEINVKILEALDIGHEGRIVMRVVPAPGRTAAVVVEQIPLYCSDVALRLRR